MQQKVALVLQLITTCNMSGSWGIGVANMPKIELGLGAKMVALHKKKVKAMKVD